MPQWLHLVEKRCAPLVNSASIDGLAHHRFYVKDGNSGKSFLIDTGADVSEYPRKWLAENGKKCEYELFAANGSRIEIFKIFFEFFHFQKFFFRKFFSIFFFPKNFFTKIFFEFFFFRKIFFTKIVFYKFFFGENFYYRIFFGENFSFHENIFAKIVFTIFSRISFVSDVCEIMYFAKNFIRNFAFREYFRFEILVYGKKIVNFFFDFLERSSLHEGRAGNLFHRK